MGAGGCSLNSTSGVSEFLGEIASHGHVVIADGTPVVQGHEGVPVVLASTPVGHGGTYPQDNGGDFARVNLAWLSWWMRADEGATGKGMFVGDGCGLCGNSAWTLQTKNVP